MKIIKPAVMAYNADGVELGKVSDGTFKITNLPKSGEQSIPADMSKLGLAKNNYTKTATHITFHTSDGDVSFRIHQPPGRYCVTCGEKLPDFAGNGTAQEAFAVRRCLDHIKKHGDEALVTDKWPNGYASHPFSYRCIIEETPLTKRLMAQGK